ncbi:MAG: hypothetical protein JRG96_10990 [Deltaproteobacteria bacterium]|nr:hypothetical protein [Deltaproteobacteria bacterium]MBW2418171.1 hypothetical protein [Deltaproteobacteria bacterium]
MADHDESCGGWRIAFRHPGALAGAFLAGGILAFGYSYIPLHSAKNWKIDYQESRLASQREKLEEFEAKLTTAEAGAARAERLEEQAPRRQELDEAVAKLRTLEAKLSDLEKQNGKLSRSRDSWRSRHAAAEKERDEWKAEAEGLDMHLAEDAPEASAPAQPIDATLLEGASWASPDGHASFTLITAAEDHATLDLGPGGGRLRVEAGSNIRIGDPARGSYRVTVMEIQAGRAIGISAVPETSDLLTAPLGSAAAPAPR